MPSESSFKEIDWSPYKEYQKIFKDKYLDILFIRKMHGDKECTKCSGFFGKLEHVPEEIFDKDIEKFTEALNDFIEKVRANPRYNPSVSNAIDHIIAEFKEELTGKLKFIG